MANKPDCLEQGAVPFWLLHKSFPASYLAGMEKAMSFFLLESPPQREPRTLPFGGYSQKRTSPGDGSCTCKRDAS